MDYFISAPAPHNRFIRIVAIKKIITQEEILLQLPSWRPGRYELGNFAKNLRNLKISDANGNALPINKISKDCWKIEKLIPGNISIEYDYFAAQPDAGACWLDENLMYVNPVHCMMYDPENIHEPCKLHLDIPSDWQIACSLKKENKNELIAADFHELVDSPFIAANSLKHKSYTVDEHKFNIWIYGECTPDWPRILKDFEGFSRVQLMMMKKLPEREYHFLILLLPFRFYHGVEHTSSTVLALGPGYQLMQDELYNQLLGVASHELFHAWNVKTLRPVDFNIYDYTKENYSRLGWVYEGFTTYYGDLFLARSGFFSVTAYLHEINQRLQKHLDNYGRFNLSVAASSYDTWLDGYVPGIPHRKTSIYDEGSLIALMLDLFIRQSTNDLKSLDDLFKQLYLDFGPQQHGYLEQDIRLLANNISGKDAGFIFDMLINIAASYENNLQELLHHVGCYISKSPSKNAGEKYFGFRSIIEGGITKVLSIIPGSPADNAGLSKEDEIISCNGWKVENNLSDLINAGQEKTISLVVFTQKKMRIIELEKNEITYFDIAKVMLIKDASDQQKKSFKLWSSLEFQ